MSIWLVRAGAHGEYEQRFVQESRVYVTCDGLDAQLDRLADRDELVAALSKRYLDVKPKAISNWVSQLWPLAHGFEKGDLVVMPLETQGTIQIGEVAGDYHFEPNGPDPFFHWRPVKWIGEAIPRSHFGQDLLNSFGAFITICRVQRNNAETRLRAMQGSGWKPRFGHHSCAID